MQLSLGQEQAEIEGDTIMLPGISTLPEADEEMLALTVEKIRELRVMPMDAFDREIERMQRDAIQSNFFIGH